MFSFRVLGLTSLALMMSAAAMAGDSAVIASGKGPGGGGTPIGGGGCTYSYSIQKIGENYAHTSDELTYYVFVKNLGTCRLHHIDLVDQLPRGVEFVSANPDPVSTHHGLLRWEHFDLAPGHLKFVKITVHTKDWNRPFQVTNTACAFSSWIGTRVCDSVNTVVFPHDTDLSSVDAHGGAISEFQE